MKKKKEGRNNLLLFLIVIFLPFFIAVMVSSTSIDPGLNHFGLLNSKIISGEIKSSLDKKIDIDKKGLSFSARDNFNGYKIIGLTGNESKLYNVNLEGDILTITPKSFRQVDEVRNYDPNRTIQECVNSDDDSCLEWENITYFVEPSLPVRAEGQRNIGTVERNADNTFILDLSQFNNEPIIKIGFETIIIQGNTSYASTDTNITQDFGFAHLNTSNLSLHGYWSFDGDNITTANDLTDYNNDGIFVAAGNLNQSCNSGYGDCLSVYGWQTGSSVIVPDDTTLDFREALTISAWVQPFDADGFTASFRTIVGKGPHQSQAYTFVWDSLAGELELIFNDNDLNRLTVPYGYDDKIGEWHHVAATWNKNGDRRIYADGALIGNDSTFVDTILNDVEDLNIGWDGDFGSDRYFNGSIDEVMVFNATLNASDIEMIYSNQSERFFYRGEMVFENQNFTGNNTVNVSVGNISTLLGSYVQFQINDGDVVNLTNGQVFYYNITGDLNDSDVKLIPRTQSETNRFYTPIIRGNITLDSWIAGDAPPDNPPLVTVNFPTNVTYNLMDLPLVFDVDLNENGSIMYSLDAGINNVSMTSTDEGSSFGTMFQDTNNSIADGVYVFQVYANDTAGNQNNTVNVTFSLDTNVSLVTINSPTEPIYNAAALPLIINISVNQNGSVEYSLDGGVNNISMLSTDEVSSFGFLFNDTNDSIADGDYTLNVYANDTNGNINHTVSFDFLVDQTAPVVTINSPEATTYTEDDLPLIFNVSLDQNGSVLYSLDDGVNNISMLSTDEISSFGQLFNATNSSIAQGTYTFSVYANDTVGNVNLTDSVTFNFAGDAPLVTINFPENNTYNLMDLPLVFNVSLDKNGSVEYSLDSGINNISMSSTDEESYFGQLFNATNGSIADGSYVFQVYANDTAGNTNWTENVSFSVDATPPHFTGIPGNATLTYATDGLAVTFNATDNIAFLNFSINWTNSFDINDSGHLINTSVLGAGFYQIIVTINDTALNTNSTVYGVNITQASPVLSLDISPANSVPYDVETTATGTSCPAQITCTLYLQNESVSNPDTNTLGVGNWVYIYNTTGNDNYTTAEVIDILNVTQGNGAIAALLDHVAADDSVFNNTFVWLNGTLINGTATEDIQLLLEGVIINQGVSPIGNRTAFNSTLGVFNITAFWPGDDNWTSASASVFLTVQATPSLTDKCNASLQVPGVLDDNQPYGRLCHVIEVELQTFKQRDQISLEFPLFENDLTKCVLCDGTITIFYPNNSVLVRDTQLAINDNYASYTLESVNTSLLGTYSYSVVFDNGVNNGISNGNFDITSTGRQDNFLITLLALILVYSFLVVGIWKRDITITLLGTFGLYIVGIWLLFTGMDGIKNWMTDGFAFINLGLAFYLSVIMSYEYLVDGV